MRKAITAISAVPVGVRWLVTVALVVVIVALSVTPDRHRPGDTVFHWLVVNTSTWVQKTLHVVVYALLAALLVWALDDVESRRVRLLLALVSAVGLGAALEWYQLRVPGRFGNVTDVLLNAAGAILGLIAATLLF